MASELIQFRLSGAALEELRAKQQEGESLNLAAQRLMRDLLGIVDKPVDIDERIEAKLENAIAPLQNQIEELKGTNVDNSIQVVVESLTSRIEQLEQRLQGEGTGESISTTEIGVIKSQKQLQAEGLISYRQLKQAKEGIDITANDGSIWQFEGREPGANGAKKFRCVALGKIQGREAA